MIKFSSIVDRVTYDKIKCGYKCIKFFLCDEKRKNLSIGDVFKLEKSDHSFCHVQVVNIEKSKNLSKLVKSFSLQLLGEVDYNTAYLNVKKWFSDEKIEKNAIMAVKIRIINE